MQILNYPIEALKTEIMFMRFNIMFKYEGTSDDAYSLMQYLSKSLGVHVEISRDEGYSGDYNKT